MALRGNLKDFSLPDVFQLVTFSKKTGVLRIRRADGAEGSVWFRDGDVFFAQSNWHGEPLGERLVHANRITPSALSKALNMRADEPDGGRRLGEILVEEGYITDKVLEAFVQEQIQDTIFDLMRWDEGDFDFELLPDVVDEDIGLSVSIENVIMEGSRRLEEWTRIKKKIPSMDIVFKMATAPGEGTFEISLKPIEWNLLLLVDGTRSVSQLARETNRTDFEVARIMYGLFSAGLLEVASDEEIEQLRAERVERESVLAEIRAEEAKAVKAATDEALAREAALDAEAKTRIEASEVTEEAAAVAEADERSEPEVPEFLSAGFGDTEATPEDMAVFEQMMGAVLETPVEPVAAEKQLDQPAELAVPEQTVPVTEPEIPEPEQPESEELSVADDATDALSPPVEDVVVPESGEVADSVELDVGAQMVEEPMSGRVDFEADLMALGLGELPGADLLTPAGQETAPDSAPVESELVAEQGEPEAIGQDIVDLEAPVELEAFLKDLEVEKTDAPSAEQPAAEEPAILELPEQPDIDMVDLSDMILDTGEPVGDAQAIDSEETDVVASEEAGLSLAAETPDLSDILSSLEEEPGLGETEIVQTPDLEGDIAEAQAPSSGVISTDAYLADISPDGFGVGLSTGLGDELSALTGASGRSRPTASVRRIPESGQSVELKRDVTVNKDLVLKIIEGIKNL